MAAGTPGKFWNPGEHSNPSTEATTSTSATTAPHLQLYGGSFRAIYKQAGPARRQRALPSLKRHHLSLLDLLFFLVLLSRSSSLLQAYLRTPDRNIIKSQTNTRKRQRAIPHHGGEVRPPRLRQGLHRCRGAMRLPPRPSHLPRRPERYSLSAYHATPHCRFHLTFILHFVISMETPIAPVLVP